MMEKTLILKHISRMLCLLISYSKFTRTKDLTGLNTAEKEVLYKRGSKFKVENIVEQDGVIFIMEVEA